MNILTPETFASVQNEQNLQLIDTRLPDFFELSFVKGALNISLNLTKGKEIGACINPQNETIIICKPGTETESLQHLETFNIKNILGVFPVDSQNLKTFDMVISISSEELVLDSLHNPKALIIDVRSESKYQAGKVHNAINIPINELANKSKSLNKNQETIIYCTKGSTSMLACSYLKANGFTNIKNVWGGFEQIQKEPKALFTKA